jgi:hypothetical protein
LSGYQEANMDKIASSSVIALCLASALPAWAQTHALDGAVTFSDLQVTAAAIDPGGPAPWVNQTARPFAHLYSYLCFPADFCQQQYAGSFDRLVVATLRNDTADVENVWWYLHSGLDLQLMPAVPEPAAWLTLLFGLALLLPRAGAMPIFVSLRQKM